MDTSDVNLLNLIDSPLKKVATTEGGEYHGPCPFCGGKDRFVVQPHRPGGGRWLCRHCSPRWEDAIAYIRQRDGCTFSEAVRTLGLPLPENSPRRLPPPPPSTIRGLNSTAPALTDPLWQSHAQAFVQASQEQLWSRAGGVALNYLWQRGLTNDVIYEAALGYNPQAGSAQWGETPVWLAAGIVIPWRLHHQYWRIRFRQLPPVTGKKYTQVKGGANGLYGAQTVTPGCRVILVEGEFDALVIRNQAPQLIRQGFVPVATGGTQNARATRWEMLLRLAAEVLIAFDADANGAGEAAAVWWQEQLGQRARRLRPTRHDVTDMVLAGDDLYDWVNPAH